MMVCMSHGAISRVSGGSAPSVGSSADDGWMVRPGTTGATPLSTTAVVSAARSMSASRPKRSAWATISRASELATTCASKPPR